MNDPYYQLARDSKAETWRIADRVITTFAVNKASSGKATEWNVAKSELAKAETDWAAGHDGSAFDHLKNAWAHAQTAMR